jgi:glycosyl transferase family 87
VERRSPVIDGSRASTRNVARGGVQLYRSPHRTPRLRQVRGAVPWICAVLLAVIEVVAHWFHLPRDGRWIDTYVYARSASTFLSHPTHLYDAAVRQLHSTSAENAFLYPPSALAAFLPFVPVTRLLGVTWTAELWSWIDTAALLLGLTLVARQLSMGLERTGWVMAVLLLSLPVLSEVDSGQVEGVIVLLLALSWRSWPRPSSGVLLGLALAVKPVALPLLVVPLALGRPRVTLVAVMAFLVLNVPFLPFIGRDGLAFYLLHFLPYMSVHVMQDVANLSVANLLHTWMGGVAMQAGDHGAATPLHSMALANIVLWTIRGTALILLARELVQRRHSPVVGLAMALAVVPVLAPTAWAHYDVFLVPAALVLLTAQSVRVRRVTLGALIACTLLNSALDIATFHLAPYPVDLAHSTDLANALVVLQGALLAVASVAVVVAVGTVRLPLHAAWRPVRMQSVRG